MLLYIILLIFIKCKNMDFSFVLVSCIFCYYSHSPSVIRPDDSEGSWVPTWRPTPPRCSASRQRGGAARRDRPWLTTRGWARR